ncbi:MAG: 4Fe-4S dicluster domain-containing protein [Desulfovibrio sp.]|jgi:ferredoxin|nr:4Fe-4S dicluster domain-containing protein [Desulfovibrio sp.]
MSEQKIVSRKFISLGYLPAWLEELALGRTVYVPRQEGRTVLYRPFVPGDLPEFSRRPAESAKHVLFPRSEGLFSFCRKGDPGAPDTRGLLLSESAEPGQAVIFGALSCDARGFFAFDPVYDGCGTKGIAKDVYYLKRRENTALIVKACKTPLSTCFCHWTGGGPASAQGADALATDLDGGILLQAVTKKGAALLESAKLSPATDDQEASARAAHEAAVKAMPSSPSLDGAPEALLGLFDNKAFWHAQSAGCLSCGACTYLCPTCYCFNLTDESNGIAGTRLRTWDTCMSALFTMEASGHNPRRDKAARLKNRVGHKFSYYPRIHDGRFSCCGCGRCIRSCPSSVDIRQIVLNALKENADV